MGRGGRVTVASACWSLEGRIWREAADLDRGLRAEGPWLGVGLGRRAWVWSDPLFLVKDQIVGCVASGQGPPR